MKKLILCTMLGMAAMMSAPVQAVTTATGNFNVVINLTAVCAVNSTGNGSVNFTSLSGQTAATAATASITCTNALPYTVTLNGTGASNVYSYTDTYAAGTNDNGTDLSYTLTLAQSGGTGTLSTAGANAGSGAAQTYSITPAISGSASGRCATAGGACSNTKAHVLTITY
jgi:spore coat protein U-like protein